MTRTPSDCPAAQGARPVSGYAEQCTRVYTPWGRVAHLRAPFGTIRDGNTLCPVTPKWPGEWLGTGGHAEYEYAASLPACKACLDAAGGEDEYYAEPRQFTDPAEATP